MSFVDCPAFRTQPCRHSVKSSSTLRRLPRPSKVFTRQSPADRSVRAHRLAPAHKLPCQQPPSVLHPSAHAGLRIPNSRLATPAGALPDVSTPSESRTTKAPPKSRLGPFPRTLARFVSPRQRSWASTFRALIRLEIESCLHASSFRAVAETPLTHRSTSKGCSLQEAASDRSQRPALLAFSPSEVLPLDTALHSFLCSSSHAL
jgi:hypothetical protein